MADNYIDIVQKFFTDDGWTYQLNDDHTIVISAIKMENNTYTCLAQVIPAASTVVAYMTCSESVPEGLRAKVAEFICRANYGLARTTLEMDFEDGSLRCRAGLYVEVNQLTTDLVHNLVYTAAYSMDKYYPGLMAVLYSSRTVVDILKGIEG